MSIITFWTEIEKEIGQTATAIAVATQMAMKHNHKILLITTNNQNELKEAFWKREDEVRRQGIFNSIKGNVQVGLNNGMSGVRMAMESKRLMPEHITNYTKTVFKERLEVLAGIGVKEQDYRENVFPYYPELIKKANLYYDYVIVDLNKEKNNIVYDILEMSNIIAYGINQKNGNLEKYMDSNNNGFLKGKNNIVPYIGRYDKFSKYSVKNVMRTLKTKKIDVIPYNTLFAESCDEGIAAEYFMKINTISGADRNVEFINCVQEYIDTILYKEQEIKMNYGRN